MTSQVLRLLEPLATVHAVIVGLLICRCGGLYDPVHHIESARLYGNIDEYAYWFVDLLVGTPPQRVSVILDTGSGVAAFPCASCGHCGRHIDPNFDIAKSKTAKWTSCGKGCRGSCNKGHCSYHQGYQEGSSISGYWFQDWVRLGDAIQRNPPVFTSMGCHQNENKLFYTQKANGILGIRGSGTLLKELFADRKHVQTSIFAMCLAEWGGRLVVGGHNSSYHAGKLEWIPLNPSSYAVTLSGMKVPGQRQIGNFGHTMVDSGTTYTYMGSQRYKELRRQIESYCGSHGGCRARRSGTCWNCPHGLASFPTVEVYFGKVKTFWEPRSYLYRKGTSKQYCYSFEDDGPNAGTVLGASWMLYHEVIFDLNTRRLGIVPANCPEFRRRPKHRTTDLDPPTVPPPTSAPLLAEPAATAAPATVITAAPTPAPASAGSGKVGATAAPTPSPVSQVAMPPPEPSPTFEPMPAASVQAPSDAEGSESFMGFAKIAVGAGVGAIALLGVACCVCRARRRGAEISAAKAAPSAAPPTVVGGEAAVNEEENLSLVNGRAESSTMEL